MEKTNAPIETCMRKKCVNIHKRHLKIDNKMSNIKPYWKLTKCNLKQRFLFHISNGQNN